MTQDEETARNLLAGLHLMLQRMELVPHFGSSSHAIAVDLSAGVMLYVPQVVAALEAARLEGQQEGTSKCCAFC